MFQVLHKSSLHMQSFNILLSTFSHPLPGKVTYFGVWIVKDILKEIVIFIVEDLPCPTTSKFGQGREGGGGGENWRPYPPSRNTCSTIVC